jgi:hypothetical protein
MKEKLWECVCIIHIALSCSQFCRLFRFFLPFPFHFSLCVTKDPSTLVNSRCCVLRYGVIFCPQISNARSRFSREGGGSSHRMRTPGPNRGGVGGGGGGTGEFSMSLDKIVTAYLREQHALCRNPVVTCPQMSLFE